MESLELYLHIWEIMEVELHTRKNGKFKKANVTIYMADDII